jgi:hypothetical protein
MNTPSTLESELVNIINEALGIIVTAKRNKKAVTSGGNFYAIKFSELRTKSIIVLENLEHNFADDPELSQITRDLSSDVELFFEPSIASSERSRIGKKILSNFKTLIAPCLQKKSSHVPTDKLFPFELVSEDRRGYVRKITTQALGCYDLGWYDACAVMIRRLLETLIIECFESRGIASKIQNQDGNFLYLQDLISKFLQDNDGKWNASRNTKNALPNLKDIGDKSAHSRYFTARQPDIDNIKNDLRTVIEELVNISRP